MLRLVVGRRSSTVSEMLVRGLGVRAVVVGQNFRFGHKARGDTAMLATMGRELGFSFEAVSLQELDGRPVSSSAIRRAIADCDLAWANRALGRRHRVPGRVIRGKGRGVGLGFPTANIDPPERQESFEGLARLVEAAPQLLYCSRVPGKPSAGAASSPASAIPVVPITMCIPRPRHERAFSITDRGVVKSTTTSTPSSASVDPATMRSPTAVPS